MYEFTMKGIWVRWGALDMPSRWLFAGSGAAAFAALVPLYVPGAVTRRSYLFDLGYYVGSGGKWPVRAAETSASMLPWAAWWIVGCLAVSALLWWRLSVRQDELFNRIQNWAFAMGGAWSATLLSVWSIFDMADLASPITPAAVITVFAVAISVFWFVAVRRWA